MTPEEKEKQEYIDNVAIQAMISDVRKDGVNINTTRYDSEKYYKLAEDMWKTRDKYVNR